MSERLTDKKRGFLGEPGNLISNVNGLSLNRFMREELGGLFQTQVKRFTPDGNVTVKGFGMYEEVMSEPIAKKEKITTANERLVVLEVYAARKIVSLIIIKPSGYTVLHSVDTYPLYLQGAGPISASWNYNKNCFIVFAGVAGGWGIFEITTGGVFTRMALFTWGSGWDDWPVYANPMRLFHSYGTTGANNLMWIGMYEWNKGFTHVLTLNSSYRFGRYIASPVAPDQYMLVNYSDCDAYFEPTTSGSKLAWVTHDNVRIVRPLYYDADYEVYWPKDLRSCEVGKKIANIFRAIVPGEGSNERESSIHLCSSPYPSAATLNESTGRKETPPSYLTAYSIVKNSERVIIPGTGTLWYENRYYDKTYFGQEGVLREITLVEMPVSNEYGEPNKIAVHLHSDSTLPYDWIYYFSYWGGDASDYVIEYFYQPGGWEGGIIWVTNPGGVLTRIIPEVDYWDGVYFLICWVKVENAGSIVYEWYNEIAYVNKHYIVTAQQPTSPFINKIFVADGSGAEKYTIPLYDSYLVNSISLNRVITK